MLIEPKFSCSANQVVQQCRILKNLAVMAMLKSTVQYLAMVHIYTCTTFHGLAAAFSFL